MSKIELIIFISSRSDEFASDRLILSDELKKIDMKPIIFEYYGAQDTSMNDANINDVRSCNIFIGLYGSRYSEPTYQEFKEAIVNNKHCLFYFKRYIREEPEQKMKEFIQQIKEQNKIHKNFNDVIELKRIVIEDVISEISKGFINYRYKISDVIQKEIDVIINASDDYNQFLNFVKTYKFTTKIVKITKINEKLKIIIDKGYNHHLFENIEFYIKQENALKFKIIVESLQENLSICIPIDKLPDTFEKNYLNYSLEMIDLSRKEFIERKIWRRKK